MSSFMSSSIYKFGYNSDVDAAEDLWSAGGDHTFPTSATTTTVVSSSTSDDVGSTGALTLFVQGVDGNYMQQSETVSMDGTSAVTLTKEYLRVYRMQVLTAGSNGTNVGNITANHGATVLAHVGAGFGQTLQAIYTVPADYVYANLLSWDASVTNWSANSAATVAIQMRENGGAWQTKDIRGVANGSNIEHFVRQHTDGRLPVGTGIIAAKTDIRMRITAVTAVNMGIAGGFTLELKS